MGLQVKEIIKIAEKQMADAGVRDAQIDAKELFCYMMDYDKVGLMMHWQDMLQDNQCEAYFDLVAERASRIPLQHITGTQEFMGHTFKVSGDVLIPRQDTETMVEDAIELLGKGTLRNADYNSDVRMKDNPDILDLCCGSGAIGISLAKAFPKASVVCSDISKEALALATENAKSNSAKNVKFVESDMLSAAYFNGKLKSKKFDLIISNPPYIQSSVIDTLEPEVKDHEPRMALDGGEDGLDFYRQIASDAAAHLKKNGILMMEIGYDQRDAVKALLAETGAYEKIIGLTDLAGLDRIVVARKKPEDKKHK